MATQEGEGWRGLIPHSGLPRCCQAPLNEGNITAGFVSLITSSSERFG